MQHDSVRRYLAEVHGAKQIAIGSGSQVKVFANTTRGHRWYPVGKLRQVYAAARRYYAR